MPKNQVTDLITDLEIAFARLILSGTMTDRAAAQAVGLNPDTAAYTKAKPRVRAYMTEHRAAVQQQLVEQEADRSRLAVEELRRQNRWREQVLDRLWEIAGLPAEATRGSITGQVKAISMIVAIEGMIPDRRAGSSDKKSAPTPSQPDIHPSAWLRRQQENAIDPQPGPALVDDKDETFLAEAEPASGSAADAPPPPGPIVDPSEPAFANRLGSSEATPSVSHAPAFVSPPDTRVPFSIKKNPFARRH
jgi:hypothetical protein